MTETKYFNFRKCRNLTHKKLLKKFRKIYIFLADQDLQFHFRLDPDPQNKIADPKHRFFV